MKRLLLLLSLFLLFSCTQKIVMTDVNNNKSKTLKYRGAVVIDNEHVRFTTIKGTKQSVPKNMYEFKVE